MLLVTAAEARVGQVHLGREVIVEVLVVSDGIVFGGRVHNLLSASSVLGLVRLDGDPLGDRLLRRRWRWSGGGRGGGGGGGSGPDAGSVGVGDRRGHEYRGPGMVADGLWHAQLLLMSQSQGQLFYRHVVGGGHVEKRHHGRGIHLVGQLPAVHGRLLLVVVRRGHRHHDYRSSFDRVLRALRKRL